MKYATVAQVAALGLFSQATLGQDMQCRPQCNCCTNYPDNCEFDCLASFASGEVKAPSDSRQLLEEDASGVSGQVLMKLFDDGSAFVLTNAINFPQGITNGVLTVATSDLGDCNSDAYGRASKLQLEQVPVTYEINDLGMIEGKNGWFTQFIQENSTFPVSLAELVSGNGSDSLAVYLLSSDEELLGCASMKKIDDEDNVAEYQELITGLSQDQEAVQEGPSSGSNIGLFVVSVIAAVGIATVLGSVFAL